MTPRERASRRLAALAIPVVVALLVIADFAVDHKPHFEGTGYTFDTAPLFYPALGFLSTVLLVLISRALGILLSRREGYYREP